MGNIACLERLDDTFCGPRAQKFLAPTPKCISVRERVRLFNLKNEKRSAKVQDPISSSLSWRSLNWKSATLQRFIAQNTHVGGGAEKGLCSCSEMRNEKEAFYIFDNVEHNELWEGWDRLCASKNPSFFLQMFNDPGVIARSACRLLMLCSLKGWARLTAFSMHSKRSYELGYGSWLSTKSQAGKRYNLDGGSFGGDIDEFFQVLFALRNQKDQVGPINFSAWLGIEEKTPARQVGKHLPLSGAEVRCGELGCKACFSSIIKE